MTGFSGTKIDWMSAGQYRLNFGSDISCYLRYEHCKIIGQNNQKYSQKESIAIFPEIFIDGEKFKQNIMIL